MTVDSTYRYNDRAVLPNAVGCAARTQGCQYASSRDPRSSAPVLWPPLRSCRLFSRLSTLCCASAATMLCWPCLRASGTGLCEWGRGVWSGLRDGPGWGRELEAPCHFTVRSLGALGFDFGARWCTERRFLGSCHRVSPELGLTHPVPLLCSLCFITWHS